MVSETILPTSLWNCVQLLLKLNQLPYLLIWVPLTQTTLISLSTHFNIVQLFTFFITDWNSRLLDDFYSVQIKVQLLLTNSDFWKIYSYASTIALSLRTWDQFDHVIWFESNIVLFILLFKFSTVEHQEAFSYILSCFEITGNFNCCLLCCSF